MKKTAGILLAALLIPALLAGCGEKAGPLPTEAPSPAPTAPPIETAAPAASPAGGSPGLLQLEGLEFYYSSGAGGWQSVLHIAPDGSFSGFYEDSDMGDSGEKYPGGTRYESRFTGQLSAPEPLDGYRSRLELLSLSCEREPGEEELSQGVRIVYTGAQGLEEAGELILYRPETPLASLPEDFLRWTHRRPEEGGALGAYGLYNVSGGAGFVAYPPLPAPDPGDTARQLLEEARSLDGELMKKLESPELSQSELNALSAERFRCWDSCLNSLWTLLMEELPEEERESLTREELDWIRAKEAAAAESGRQAEGGSLQPLLESDTAADWTKERCYILAGYLEP